MVVKRPPPDEKARALLDRYGKAGAHVTAAGAARRARSDETAAWWGMVLRWIEVLP